MAASRRGQPPLSVRLPPPTTAAAVLPDLPPVSALFLIDFDVKAGYTITWKRAVPGLELEGAVEYKSLPSGLHTVADDLIYFVHDGGHAGLSAFVNTPTDEEETRHARMIAVGVLVPLSYGRLGRAWRHAEGLKEMAAKLAADRTQTQLLAEYWDQNGLREPAAQQPLKDAPLESPLFVKPSRPAPGKAHVRNRSASDGTALIPPGHRLSPFHPAWSLTALLDTFGPLIFPIHRAALLRKRILISCHAPVHEVCNFVYDISVLSNIPLSICDVIEPSAPVQRLRPLFCIGVHDISYLLEHQATLKHNGRADPPANGDDAGAGWVACTTDSILAMKEDLWDMLITMPPPYASNAAQRVWPTVECPKGVPVKATQRDLRRFRSLTLGLARLAPAPSQTAPPKPRSPHSETSDSPAVTNPAIRLSRSAAGGASSRPGTSADNHPPPPPSGDADDTDTIVEPTTWAALAYNGFMWWASAGEKRHSDEVDELSRDAALLADLAEPPLSPAMGGRRRESFGVSAPGPVGGMAASLASLTARVGGDGVDEEEEDGEEARARVELAVVAYFHRLTTSVLSVLADIVDSSDEDDLLDLRFDRGDGEFDGPAVGREESEEDEDARTPHGEEARLLLSSNGGSGGGWVRVDSEAMAEMGLDVWSQPDADFVGEVAGRYFGRRAYVETKGVEVCGVRVC
ncbi:hypothetical protein C8A05DRAFT_18977 [Staphylotrichum tortipilum]|uniref:DUF4484 domain-containing protein n=1 Tax=Staphylotrichum tortipilum TaxID=2831512 RepID=A0AAN6MCN5_9PEZI|nr:hypothetical protein C8A05DRAFT_18977 [Staphylotrichum longicolle]